MTFSEHLKQIRGDLTQSAFCRKLGIPMATYQRYEKGERVPNIDVFAQIVKRTGISADTLLGLDHVGGTQVQSTVDKKDLIIAQQSETIEKVTSVVKTLT
jgi:transcriptional regulator with XRE-family HTH domain